MYSPLTRELQDAYNSIYLRENIDQDVHKFSQYFMDVLVEEGYDISNITENDLYDFFVSEGAGSLLMRAVKPFIAGAKPIVKGLLKGSGVTAAVAAPAAALDQYLTGGKGREWVGATVQGLRQLGHSIPSPDQAKKMLQPPPVTPGPGGQTEPPAPRPSQQNQRNPYGLRKEGVNISPQQKSLLEEPKIGEKNKEGKIWTGTDFGYQSQATLDKQKAERAKQQRLNLGVVSGGNKSGYTISGSDKPKAGETDQQWKARRSEALKLADRLNKEQGLGKYKKPTTAPPAPPASKPDSEPPTAKPKPEPKPPAPAQTGDRTKDLTTWAKANKPMIQSVGTPQQKAILSAAEKGTAMPAPRPISKDIEDLKNMQKASQERQAAQSGPMYSSPDVKSKMSLRTQRMLGLTQDSYDLDAYDLVLEYLFSQGHVDTLDEAHYVMMQMSSEYIQKIVEDVYMGPPIKTETKPKVEKRKPETKPTESDPIMNYRSGKNPDGSPRKSSATESDPIILDRQGKNPDGSRKSVKPFPGPDFGR